MSVNDVNGPLGRNVSGMETLKGMFRDHPPLPSRALPRKPALFHIPQEASCAALAGWGSQAHFLQRKHQDTPREWFILDVVS